MAVADQVYMNGNVATVDRRFNFAHAFAVKNGWFIAVGENDEMREYVGPGTEVIDLEGRTVIPGIHDAHTHACDWSDNLLNTVDCSRANVQSLQEMLGALKAQAAALPQGKWVRGAALNSDDFAECQERGFGVTRDDLDDALPNTPAIVIHWDGHGCVANTAAMRIAGVADDTPNPPGGTIVRDENGRPTGVFQESSALQLMFRNMPRFTVAELEANILAGQRELVKMGVTGYTECTVGPCNTTREMGASGEHALAAFANLCDRGELLARVNLGFYAGKNGIQTYDTIKECLDAFEFPKFSDANWVDMRMLKMFCDGVHMGYSAWMKGDYADRPGWHGHSTFFRGDTSDEEQAEEIRRCVKLGHDRGWQVAVHTIGDKAVQVIIDAMIAAQLENPGPRHRHYVIHADSLGDHGDLYRAMRNGIGLSVQSGLMSYIFEVTEARCGAEKAGMLMATRDLVEAGMHIANGSDSIGGPYNTWQAGIEAAVTRKSLVTGRVYRPDMRLTVPQALYQFTMGGAYQEFRESVLGSIEPNKLADFVVLDENLFTIDHDAIHTVKPVMTVVGGKVMYEA